ncbi:MAG: ribonuclease III [Chloroflexota bacterium]
MDITTIQAELGLKFQDKTLLQRALTHRSYLNENPDHPLEDNERLEFLGDAALDFITGEYLYHRFPEMKEGQLTSLRSALVRTEKLAEFSQSIHLGKFLYLGKGEEENGGRERLPILCGAFEALMGALYLDQGISAVIQFFEPLMKPAIAEILENNSDKDAKSRFQELAQSWARITPTYRSLAETGPDHAKKFTVGAFLKDSCYGKGVGPNKQQAAQAAAKSALKALQKEIARAERNAAQIALK